MKITLSIEMDDCGESKIKWGWPLSDINKTKHQLMATDFEDMMADLIGEIEHQLEVRRKKCAKYSRNKR